MRGFSLAMLALAALAPAAAKAQNGRSIYEGMRHQGGIYDRSAIQHPGGNHLGNYQGHHHHHHFNSSLGRLYGHGLDYGYGYYRGFGIRGPGYGFSRYTGPSYLGPFIQPPVSPFAYGYGGYGLGYGGYNYGSSFGYGASWLPSNPVNNQWMQQKYNNEWTRLKAELASRLARNLTDPIAATTAIPIPSTPEQQIKSLDYQSQGDAAFAKQDYRRAYERYRKATQVARDDGTAYMKTGYALVAMGKFSQALDYFKRAFAIEPKLAATGPPPAEMYGDQQIAWNADLGRITDWVSEDIRDSDRVLLLGMLLYLNGDPRGEELLTKAWQLSGGRAQTVVALLSPPEIEPPTPLKPDDQPAKEAVEEIAPAAAEAPAKGPILPPVNKAAPQDAGQQEELAIPPLPAEAEEDSSDSAVSPWHQPLFPLPSEQD